MRDGPRAPVAFRSLDAALSGARGDGLAIVVSEGTFTIAFTTAFGPCLRNYQRGDGDAFLLRVIRESTGGDHDEVAIAGEGGFVRTLNADPRIRAQGAPLPVDRAEAEAALAEFSRARTSIPVHSGKGAAARARTSTIAPCPGRAYETGAVLRCVVEPRGDGCVLRWRRADGGDAGIHLLLDRMPTGEERTVLGNAEGKVVSVTPGSMPWREGTRRVQVLVLDVPHAFAEALPDGRMPRHGLAVEGA